MVFNLKEGILVDDYARSISNPNIFSVGDCTTCVPRLTHMTGEMAKVVVNTALFDDEWKLSSLVVPSCMYTEPEFTSVGIFKEDDMDVFTASLQHNALAMKHGIPLEGIGRNIHCYPTT